MDLNHPLLALAADEPPPFPPSYPQLRRMDRSVLCQICKESLQGPVSIECGHSFCSQCIRASLDVMKMKKCPTCDLVVSEGSIRRNRALEEITDAWDAARPTLINLAQPAPAGPFRKRPPPEPNSKASSSSSNTLKRARRISGSRSRSPVKAGRLDLSAAEVVSNGSESAQMDEEQDDVLEELGENDEGACPLCSARMPIASIPMHIERGCPPPKPAKANGLGNQKADWKKVFAGAGMGKEKDVEMRRILKPNYALATPAELRAILTQYGLPATGDKSALESRVQEWIILFNSNLDTSHPCSLSALRAKLNEAEASRKRDRDKGKDEMVSQMGTRDGMAKYVKDKKREFERLRKDIMDRDERRKLGNGADRPIEVD